MWLLDTQTHHLRDFIGNTAPPYAILSHTWADDEVSFLDVTTDLPGRAKLRLGWSKVAECCARARRDGHAWVWIDTCCIDKRSSAELSEAINSMWRYYEESEVCYAFLADVEVPSGVTPSGQYFVDDDLRPGTAGEVVRSAFAASRWFTRGWTLQELLAPKRVLFLARDWSTIGDRNELVELVESATGIGRSHVGGNLGSSVSVAQKMSWVSRRNTTRAEDMAYCLLGLFRINMPLLYGEGTRAFKRLQLEIIRNTADQSIYVWRCDTSSASHQAGEAQGILAESPSWFRDSGSVQVDIGGTQPVSPSSITNAGILTRLQVQPLPPLKSLSVHRYGTDADLRLIVLTCSAPDKGSVQGRVGIGIRIAGRSVETDMIPKKGKELGNYINTAVRAFPDYIHVEWRESGWPYKPIYLRY